MATDYDLRNLVKEHIHTGEYICYQKSVCGVWLLAAEKPITRPGWWKGKFALFQMPATWGEGGSICPKANSPYPTPADRQQIRDRVGEGITCRKRTVISNSRLQLIMHCLTSITLVVSGTVNLQFRGALVPVSLLSILGIVAAQVLGISWSSCS